LRVKRTKQGVLRTIFSTPAAKFSHRGHRGHWEAPSKNCAAPVR